MYVCAEGVTVVGSVGQECVPRPAHHHVVSEIKCAFGFVKLSCVMFLDAGLFPRLVLGFGVKLASFMEYTVFVFLYTFCVSAKARKASYRPAGIT